MLKGIGERSDCLGAECLDENRPTNSTPEEQLKALRSVHGLLSELHNATWKPSLFIDAVVKPLRQKEMLRKHAETMLKTYEPHVAVSDRLRIQDEVLNASSPAAGQMLGWASTLRWLDDVAPPEADLLIMRIDLILKPPLGLARRPSCVVFPFQGHMFNATDAFVYVPNEERKTLAQELLIEAPLSEDEIGLHCLLGRFPRAAPLIPEPYDANSEEMRNPLYRIAGRREKDEDEPERTYASWLMTD